MVGGARNVYHRLCPGSGASPHAIAYGQNSRFVNTRRSETLLCKSIFVPVEEPDGRFRGPRGGVVHNPGRPKTRMPEPHADALCILRDCKVGPNGRTWGAPHSGRSPSAYQPLRAGWAHAPGHSGANDRSPGAPVRAQSTTERKGRIL